MKKLRYLFALVSLSVISFCLIFVILQERIFLPAATPPGKEFRTALAIRGPETPFSQWATYFSLRSYLKKTYSAPTYFTQSKHGECKEEFISALDAALQNYPEVDIYFLAHTNHYIDWVKEVPEEHRKQLRFVYNTGCHNLEQGPEWLKSGAKAYIGHPGESSSEIFYFFFLRRWMRGYTLNEAMDESNLQMEGAMRVWYLLSIFRDNKLAEVPPALFELLSPFWSRENHLQESWAVGYGNCELQIGSRT